MYKVKLILYESEGLEDYNNQPIMLDFQTPPQKDEYLVLNAPHVLKKFYQEKVVIDMVIRAWDEKGCPFFEAHGILQR